MVDEQAQEAETEVFLQQSFVISDHALYDEDTGALPNCVYDSILLETVLINFLSVPEMLLLAMSND